MTQPNPHILENEGRPPFVKLRKWATYVSVSVAALLIVSKVAAYFLTDAVSLLSSLLDSTIDLFSSLVILISIIHASQPADAEHRYGHGKYEALAALSQSIFIIGSAAFLIFESIHRFVQPQTLEKTGVGVGVMIFSIVMTLFLVTFQKHVIKKTGSVAVTADNLHYKGDLFMNAAVIVALLLTRYTGWPYFDPIFAIGIAGVLLRSAWHIGQESMDILLDRELSQADREKIYEIVRAHGKVQDMHDLRTRSTGHYIFIEFHMEMDGNLTLDQAHDITEEIELKLYEAFPQAEVMIHPEPSGIMDNRLDERVGSA